MAGPGGRATPWWRDAVVYQVYPRSFADSDGDGVGDLPGITGRLGHLADLGVDTLWLSPVTVSPDADWGYDVADYCAVDPDDGTLADLDHLVAAAAGRGIRVLLDLVPNHTSVEHPWFVEARSARDSPRRDYYVWADPAHAQHGVVLHPHPHVAHHLGQTDRRGVGPLRVHGALPQVGRLHDVHVAVRDLPPVDRHQGTSVNGPADTGNMT